MEEKVRQAGTNRKSGRAIIFANGIYENEGRAEFYRGLLAPGDFIICADGGSEIATAIGLTPHVMIGDFDSTRPETLESCRQKGVKIFTYPAKKDKTDIELAVEYALGLGFNKIIFLGALGGRIDHTLANIALLMFLTIRQVDATIVDKYIQVRALAPDFGGLKALTLEGKPGDLLSLIPVTPQVRGVTTSGLVYPLHDAALSFGSSLGISNVFTSKSATVSATSGLMLVIATHLPR